jgi:polysaccharide deacetylase 2 family uncharacterized protein YibQ
VIAGLAIAGAPALVAQPATPIIAIVIDDLGNRPQLDQQALALPGPVTYAILPHTPYSIRHARAAFALGKDVLLHLPMDARARNNLLGPGAIHPSMDPWEIGYRIAEDLQSVPHAVGISNHMGSAMTRDHGSMMSLMQALRQCGDLFFLDSRTVPDSVALAVARDFGITAVGRDVFLDANATEVAVDRQFDTLIATARRRGQALAIAHPYAPTLTVLERRLPQLARLNIKLVGILNYLSLTSAGTTTQSPHHPLPPAARR